MDTDQLKTELDEYGFVVIQNLISSADADRMARRLMDLMSRQPNADLQVQGLRGVLNYDDQDIFLPLITNSAYLELAGHLLGPDFQLAEAGAIWIKPDAPAGGFHADVPVGWFPQARASIARRLLHDQLYLDAHRFQSRKRRHAADSLQPAFASRT